MMKTVAVFAGTSEGRVVAERLAALKVKAVVCVATEYGGELLAGLPDSIEVRVGRLDADAMVVMLRERAVAAVVDATHPYATEVSTNIALAARQAGIPVLRLARQSEDMRDALFCLTVEEAAQTAGARPGNIMLTTGVNRLDAFTAIPDFAGRCFVRVLPTIESIQKCERLGFRRSHIIAMQGPFSRDLNAALFRQFDIKVMVSKDSGKQGGYADKIRAAADCGVEAVVIGRPPQADGMELEQVVDAIAALAAGDTQWM